MNRRPQYAEQDKPASSVRPVEPAAPAAAGAVRAILQAFRNGLAPDMVIRVGARLPFELRQAYFEDWHPTEARAGAIGGISPQCRALDTRPEHHDAAKELAATLRTLVRAVSVDGEAPRDAAIKLHRGGTVSSPRTSLLPEAPTQNEWAPRAG